MHASTSQAKTQVTRHKSGGVQALVTRHKSGGVQALRERVAEAQLTTPFSQLSQQHHGVIRDIELGNSIRSNVRLLSVSVLGLLALFLSLALSFSLSLYTHTHRVLNKLLAHTHLPHKYHTHTNSCQQVKKQGMQQASRIKATASRFLGQICNVELDNMWISATPNQGLAFPEESDTVCSSRTAAQTQLCARLSAFLHVLFFLVLCLFDYVYHMYIHSCAYINIYTQAYTYKCVCIYIYIYAMYNVCVYIYTYMPCIYTCTIYVYTYVYTCMYKYVYTYTYICIYM